MAPAYKCGVCNKNVTKADSGVECEICKTWFHIGCVGIPLEFYNLLGTNKNLSFKCTKCQDNPASKNVEQKITNHLIDLDKRLTASINTLDKRFTTSFSSFANEIRADQQDLKTLIETAVANVRSDFSQSIKDIQSDVVKCNSNLSRMEDATMAKFSGFDLENNRLQRKIYRADVIISGLPAGIDNLIDPVLKICSYYKIEADDRDINHCMYLKHNKSVLVKFNSVRIRDDLMKAYIKSPKLKLCDVISTNITSRVYLNDNLTSAGVRLQNLCRALKKGKKIVWFRVFNKDVPLCKIRLHDGSERMLSYDQCAEL